MSKISVLIPVYNSVDFLDNCLNSVLNQTLKDIEIIIINDGSKDSSWDIINKYKNIDSRISVINNKINIGYGASLNIGLQHASAEHISIIESDDYAELNMLEILYKQAKTYNLDLVKSNFCYIKNNKKISSKNYNKKILYKTINSSMYPELFCLKPSVWSFLYNKKFLLNNQIFFNQTQGASFQDTSFQFKCIYFAKNIKVLDDILYNYRIDNPNSSVNSKNKAFKIINEFEVINNIFIDKNEEMEAYKLLFELKAYLWNYNRIDKKYKKIFLKKISDIFNTYNTDSFFKSKNISIKDKIKMYCIKKLLHNKKRFT